MPNFFSRLRTAAALSAALLLFAPLAAHAQLGEPIFHSVGDLSAIPNGIVTDVIQDRTGFLWIATHDGLVRYDGYELRLFRHNASDPHSIGDNRARALEVGNDGRIWIASGLGELAIYDPATERFRNFTTKDGLSGAGPRMFARGRGGMWIATSAGLDFVDDATLRITHFTAGDSPKRNNVGSLLADRHGNLWMGSLAGLAVRRPNGAIETAAPELADRAVYRFFENADGTIWIATYGGGLHVFDPKTKHTRTIDEKVRAYAMAQPVAGEVWVGTPGDGIEVRDATSGALLRSIRHDPAIAETIDSDRVNCFFRDRSGILWIGTWGDGLNRYSPADAAFRLLRYSPEREDGLTRRDIGSIFEASDGRLYIGTRGNGVDIFENGRLVDGIRATPDGLADAHVPAITETADGAIWIGTRSAMLHRYDRATRRVTRFPLRSAEETTTTVNTLTPAPDGTIWTGLTAGLVLFDPKTGKATPQRYADGKGVRSSVVKIVLARNGIVWAGTHAALAARMPGAERFERVEGLPSDFVQDVFEDRDGRIWIGMAEGLARLESFDGKRGKFASIGKRIGRDGVRCENLAQDARGRIWIDGDLVFDPKTLAYREFTRAEGSGRVLWNGAMAKLRSGTLLYGGPDGILIIDPDALQDWTYAPPVAITAIRIDGVRRPPAASLVLEPRTRSIAFEFTALDFSAPERNRYAYRLRGFESKWTEADATRRSATYTNLPPGDYALEVRAANRAGVWNTSALSLPLRMRPAFYQTTLFRIAALLALLGIAYLVYRIRVRYLKHRQRALEELVRARTSELEISERRALEASQAKSIFLATMSHELRTPLNAILGFAQLMRRSPSMSDADRQTIGIIRRSGEHLLGLINDVLSISKIEAGKLILDRRPFDPREMIATVEDMMSMRAEAAQVRFTVDVDESFPPVVEGDEGKLRQVLINLVGNGVKFAERGSVTLRARGSDGRAHFEVTDTGTGIAAEELATLFEPFVQTASGRKAKEGTGLGLTVSRRIVQGMGGDIAVSSKVGEGTAFRFDIELPASSQPIAAADARVVGLAPGERARRILVADDTAENRTLLRNLLELTGFEVREASNGAEALEICDAWQPELIFMDVRMPIVDGREAIRRIRAAEAEGTRTRIPIVALTASVFANERDDLVARGADEFLMKPFREETMFEVLTRLLGVRFAYEESEQSVLPRRRLAGLDVDEGVRRASGNAALYARLVEQFRSENANVVARIEALLHARAERDVRDLLHTLKGSAATIGARRLAAAAATLEKAWVTTGERTGLDELRGAFDEFSSAAAQLRIRRSASVPAITRAPREVIEDLRALLATNNLSATDRFDELRRLYGERPSESLARLQSAIDRLDFQRALDELSRVADEVTA